MNETPTLASNAKEGAGKGPGPLRQFWWDMLPGALPDRLVPRRSGLQPPSPDVDWITAEIATQPGALDQTRRAHDLERGRAESLETKAGAVVTLCLSLLATALAIGGYELAYVREGVAGRWWLLAPAAMSVIFLASAVIGALEIQRVGVYFWQGAEPLGREEDGVLGLIQAEEKGRRLAEWTAGRKVNAFLQVRAWLSRSLVALVISALVAIWIGSMPTSEAYKAGSKQASSTTVPAAGSSTTLRSVSTTGVSTTR